MSNVCVVTLKLNGSACTDGALAFFDPEERTPDPIWVPRSQIVNLDQVIDGLPAGEWWTIEEEIEIHLPHWYAEKSGLDIYAEEVD